MALRELAEAGGERTMIVMALGSKSQGKGKGAPRSFELRNLVVADRGSSFSSPSPTSSSSSSSSSSSRPSSSSSSLFGGHSSHATSHAHDDGGDDDEIEEETTNPFVPSIVPSLLDSV